MSLFKLPQPLKVVCIQGVHRTDGYPIVGEVYHIVAFDGRGYVSLLEDDILSHNRPGWMASRFEPVKEYRRDDG